MDGGSVFLWWCHRPAVLFQCRPVITYPLPDLHQLLPDPAPANPNQPTDQLIIQTCWVSAASLTRYRPWTAAPCSPQNLLVSLTVTQLYPAVSLPLWIWRFLLAALSVSLLKTDGHTHLVHLKRQSQQTVRHDGDHVHIFLLKVKLPWLLSFL